MFLLIFCTIHLLKYVIATDIGNAVKNCTSLVKMITLNIFIFGYVLYILFMHNVYCYYQYYHFLFNANW